jgi:hypothetical protein
VWNCNSSRGNDEDSAPDGGTETFTVAIALDTAVREVTVSPELARPLAKHRGAAGKWDTLGHSHRREHVEGRVGVRNR